MRTRYFAYGSNLCGEQMAQRCPAAEAGDVVELPGWRFAINRRGVATLLPEPDAQAVGLIWHLTADCEAALDRYEGVATGLYRRATIEVGGAPSLIYLATEARPGSPRPGYLEGILKAAEARGIAASARAGIAAWGQAVAPWLVRHVLDGYRLALGGIHGPCHWLRVRANGLALAARTPGADAEVIALFALLHDSQRHGDGRDLGHGKRAAGAVRELARDGLLRLDPSRLELLLAACEHHEHGTVSADPTIGCCWDADRLDLSRLASRPIARLLSTDAAREPGLQAEAWRRGLATTLDEAGAVAWGLDTDAWQAWARQ